MKELTLRQSIVVIIIFAVELAVMFLIQRFGLKSITFGIFALALSVVLSFFAVVVYIRRVKKKR